MPNKCLSKSAESQAQTVSDNRFDNSDNRHFQAGGPPGTNGDERLDRTNRKMRQNADDKSGHHRGEPAHEEKRNDRDESSDRSGERR